MHGSVTMASGETGHVRTPTSFLAQARSGGEDTDEIERAFDSIGAGWQAEHTLCLRMLSPHTQSPCHKVIQNEFVCRTYADSLSTTVVVRCVPVCDCAG